MTDEAERLKAHVDHLKRILDLSVVSIGICAESRDALKHENRRLNAELAAARTHIIDLIDSSQDARCADLRVTVKRAQEFLSEATRKTEVRNEPALP